MRWLTLQTELCGACSWPFCFGPPAKLACREQYTSGGTHFQFPSVGPSGVSGREGHFDLRADLEPNVLTLRTLFAGFRF